MRMNPLHRRQRSCLLLAIFAACGFASTAVIHADDYFPPPDNDGGWRTSSDTSQTTTLAGMDPARLDQAFEFTSRCTRNGGLLVVRRGYLVFEKYFGRGQRTRTPTWLRPARRSPALPAGSCCMNFTTRFPMGWRRKFSPRPFCPKRCRRTIRARADITLGQLLCMSAGFVGEGGSPTGMVMGKAQALKPAAGPEYSRPRSIFDSRSALDGPRRGIFVCLRRRISRRSYCGT